VTTFPRVNSSIGWSKTTCYTMPPPISHRGSQLAAVNITGLTLAVIVTSLRCYVRGRMLKAFGVDDWLMLAATVRLSPSRDACVILGVMS
jgi:hypothetical protein